MSKTRLSIRELSLMGLFTAIIAAMSQLSIPMPYGVPLTMQTLAIPLAGIVLGPKKGTLSTLAYILLGAIGVPVFSGFSGGIGIVLGMTGGFIMSFPAMACAAGFGGGGNHPSPASHPSQEWNVYRGGGGSGKKSVAHSYKLNVIRLVSGLVAGAIINFACGALWYSFIMSSSLGTAFAACVLPFIPMALAKIIFLVLFGERIKSVFMKVL